MHKNRYITAEPTRTQIYRLTHNFATTHHTRRKTFICNKLLCNINAMFNITVFILTHRFHSGKRESHETSVIINAVLSAFWLTHNARQVKCAHTRRTFHRTVFHRCSPNLVKFGRFFKLFFFYSFCRFSLCTLSIN